MRRGRRRQRRDPRLRPAAGRIVVVRHHGVTDEPGWGARSQHARRQAVSGATRSVEIERQNHTGFPGRPRRRAAQRSNGSSNYSPEIREPGPWTETRSPTHEGSTDEHRAERAIPARMAASDGGRRRRRRARDREPQRHRARSRPLRRRIRVWRDLRAARARPTPTPLVTISALTTLGGAEPSSRSTSTPG
jgi:hypothetical protein